MCVLFLLFSSSGTAQVSPAAAVSPPSPPVATQVRDVVTEEELTKAAQASDTLSGMMAKAVAQVPVAARPSLENSLYKKSIILYDGEKHTVVPVGAILHLPPSYRNRVVPKPVGVFTFWPSFLERNASWLGAWEVPLRMAQGDPEAAKKVLAQTSLQSRVLVAVYRGGPISILEPVIEPAVGAKSDSSAGKQSKP